MRKFPSRVRCNTILSLLYEGKNSQNQRPVKYWEIIADNLSKAGWSWGCVSAVDSLGEKSSLLTRIAATESVSLWRADEKLTALLELEMAIREARLNFQVNPSRF